MWPDTLVEWLLISMALNFLSGALVGAIWLAFKAAEMEHRCEERRMIQLQEKRTRLKTIVDNMTPEQRAMLDYLETKAAIDELSAPRVVGPR